MTEGVGARRRGSQERQSFLLDLSDEIRAQRDEAAVGTLCTRRLAEFFRVERCYFARFFPEEDRVIVGPEYRHPDLSPASKEYRLSNFPEVVRRVQTETVEYDDVAGNPELTAGDKRSLAAMDIGAFAGAAVRMGSEKVLWALVVASVAPRVWATEEIALLEDVAERAWASVERARAQEAMRESEEKYRSLFETMNQGFGIAEILVNDAGDPVDYRLLEINPQFERMTGQSPEKFVSGRTVRQAAPELEEEWHQFYGSVGVTGEPAHREIYSEAWNRWFEVSAYRIGRPEERRVAILFSDITERKRAEDALRVSEARQVFILKLNDALRLPSDPIEIQRIAAEELGRHLGVGRCGYGEVDESGEYFTVENDWTDGEMQSMSGTIRLDDFGREIISEYEAGRTIRVEDPLADERIGAHEKEAYAGVGDVRGGIGVPLVKNGRFVAAFYVHQASPREWTDTEVALVEETAERTWAAVERARAEGEIQRLNTRLEKLVDERTAELNAAIAELESFNYSVSHDLRAPLRGLAGFSQVLLDEHHQVIGEEGRHYLRRINAAAEKMGVLIEALLDLSRLSRSELKREEVNLGGLVEQLAAGLREVQPEREVHLSVETDLVVRADRGLITIALSSLLENAWKFTEGSGDPRIEFGADRSGPEPVYYLKDNGAGFDERYAHKLFAPFQRLHSSRDFPGTGIGLATVQRIVRRHNGEIWAEGEVGEGATFFFTLPRA